MSEDTKPKIQTVQQTVMRITYEKQTLTFPSLSDPPVKCCRCYPNSISSNGYCGCCNFDHATGVRESIWNPDYDDPDEPKPQDPELASEE